MGYDLSQTASSTYALVVYIFVSVRLCLLPANTTTTTTTTMTKIAQRHKELQMTKNIGWLIPSSARLVGNVVSFTTAAATTTSANHTNVN